MINFVWKILEVFANNGVITHAKYFVTATNENFTVETEGNWFFSDLTVKFPIAEIGQDQLAKWIEEDSIRDGESSIITRLKEQLETLKQSNKVPLPWLPPVFTLNI